MALGVSDVAALRANLSAAGYTWLALYNPDQEQTTTGEPIAEKSRGKVPMAAKWQQGGPQPLDVRALNTGILATGLQAIDIDIDDPELARTIRDLAAARWGEAPLRSRGSGPRCLMLCRAPPGMQPAKRSVAGPLGKVEVLGRGQQFQAFGTHYTGAELQWLPERPGDIAADQLPIAKYEDVAEFLREVAPLLGTAPETTQPHHKLNGTHAPSARGLVANIFDVAADIRAIPNDGPPDWEAWNRIGMALWAATRGAEAGRELWHAWSSRHPAYNETETNARWDHYATSPPTAIGAGTLRHLARRTEEEHPPFEPPPDPEPEPPADKIRPLWHSDKPWSEADIPPRAWIAHGFLLRGAVSLIAGAGSAGKSMLVKAWIVSCATGLPFSRFDPKTPIRVLSYNVEDDLHEERRRLSAALRQFNRTPFDISKNLRIVGPTDIGTLIERDQENGRMRLTDAMVELTQHINSFQPDVVFLDPLVELHTAEENDNTGLRAVLAQFRALAVRYNIALVILHHVRKGLIVPGDPDGIRGAGSIVGAGRNVFTLCVMSEEDATNLGIRKENRRNYFRIDGAKMNYAPLDDAEWFERVVHTLDNGEEIVAAQPWMPPRDVITSDTLESIKIRLDKGINGEPYTLRSGTPRFFGHICADAGVTTNGGFSEVAGSLRAAGYEEADYKRHNRTTAKGLRSPSGMPDFVRWSSS